MARNHYPEARRKRIILLYLAGLVVPGLILSAFAFRGIRNDQALREKQRRNEVQLMAAELFVRLDDLVATVPDTICWIIIESGEGVTRLVRSSLLYLPDSLLPRPKPYLENQDLREAWAAEFREGDLMSAYRHYSSALNLAAGGRDSVSALTGLARIAVREGKRDEAIRIYGLIQSRHAGEVSEAGLPAAGLAMLELIRLQRMDGQPEAACHTADMLVDFLMNPPVAYGEAEFGFLNDQLRSSGITLDTGLLAQLDREIRRTRFLEGWIRNPESLFRSDLGRRKYLESSEFPALLTLSQAGDSPRRAGIIDLKQLLAVSMPQWTQRLDPDARHRWNVTTEYREGLWTAGKPETGLAIQIPFPAGYPPWKLAIQPVPLTNRQILFSTSQGLFVFIFIFIALVMTAGLAFIIRTLNQEMRLSRMKSDFISNVSHEFKTPLTSIRHMTEIMALKRIPSEQRREEYLQSMLEQCDHLGHLIENILDFSKIEQDVKNYRFDLQDPDELLEELMPTFRNRIPDPDFQLTYRCERPVPRVSFDRDAIIQVFFNLLDNAYKYSGNSKRIEIMLERSGESGIRATVRDWGIGIPEKDRERIFERFYRGDRLRTEGIKGSGIGLTIVKRIIDAHHGNIRVDANLEGGSEFILYLPVYQTNKNV